MSFCGSPYCFLTVAFACSVIYGFALTVQEILLYRRLNDLVDNIDQFYQLVVSSRKG